MSKINRGGRQTQSSTYVQIDLAGQVPGAPGQAFGHCELCVHGLHRLLKCQRGAPFKTNHTLSSATTCDRKSKTQTVGTQSLTELLPSPPSYPFLRLETSSANASYSTDFTSRDIEINLTCH